TTSGPCPSAVDDRTAVGRARQDSTRVASSNTTRSRTTSQPGGAHDAPSVIGVAANSLIAFCACTSATAHDAVLASVAIKNTRTECIFNPFGSRARRQIRSATNGTTRRGGLLRTSATTMPRSSLWFLGGLLV